jgi:hypothetical protein
MGILYFWLKQRFWKEQVKYRNSNSGGATVILQTYGFRMSIGRGSFLKDLMRRLVKVFN